jgi:hypothetical protein
MNSALYIGIFAYLFLGVAVCYAQGDLKVMAKDAPWRARVLDALTLMVLIVCWPLEIFTR